MSNGYRTLSQHLNDLKKENFSLKLRIYFLEERIQQKYEESSEDVYRSNIELKVEVESLKQELQEKQELLDQALTTAESLTNQNEAELQRRCQDRQQEIDHMQQVLETKIQLLQEEALLARSQAQHMAAVAGSPSSDTSMETMEDQSFLSPSPSNTNINKDKFIAELRKQLDSKDAIIKDLSGQKTTLTLRVGELEGQVHQLSSSLTQKDKDVEFYQEELSQERLRVEQEMQSLVEERQSQLSQYECAAGQCVSELHKAQLQVQSLQAKVDESETNNLKLQEKLDEMESELRLLRQAAQSSERTIQGLTESISTKDGEAQELYQLIEGQNATLCTLQELAHRNQLSQRTTPAGGVGDALTLSRLQGELVGVQSSLFSLGLELEASQRSLRHSQRQGEDVFRFKDRLNSDLQEALQHREETEKHNQDLRCSLHKLRLELEAKEAQLKENEVQGLVAEQEKDRTIAQLQSSVQDKQRLLEEYSEMLELTRSSKPRDALLDKMRERIKERDKALERSIDEKFRTLEDHDAEVRSLQLALREKERDLERLRCILSNNEQTLTSVDTVLRAKELELEQAADAYRNLQWLRTQSEQEERHALTERDAIISQLQDALHTHSQETQALTAARAPPGPGEAVEELKARLALKEKLIQELLSDRRRQSEERHAEVHELLNALGSKDQYLQDSSHRLSQVITERTAQLQELRAQLSLREQELMELRREKEREKGGEGVQMRVLIKEKEALIQELMQAQESQQEVKVLQEELQLLLKKDKEAQEELCALRSALAQQASHNTTTDHKVELDQLVSQYNQLNDALRTEKSLYQSLTHAHSSSSAHTLALHTELDSVQALRGQLDEVLSRARHTALTLQQRQPDFGGGNGHDGCVANANR